jgi:hypothetical protein
LAVGLTASAGAGLLALTSIAHSAFAFGDSGSVAGPGLDIGLVLGGSGTPIPGMDYVKAADLLYLDGLNPPKFPGLTFYEATPTNPYGSGLPTPEGLYPLEGVHSLPFNYPSDPTSTPIAGFPSQSTSVGQGVTILDNAIHSNIAAGDTTTVFGYSQSATIAGLVMQNLTAENVPGSDVNFVLVGDPSAPNGGLLERFNGFETSSGHTFDSPSATVPSLGIAFNSYTPDDAYTTAIYSQEYDGFTDFPQYPLNFLADLNAFLGIETLHGNYLGTATTSPPDLSTAMTLPTDPAYGTDTTYYMIPETAPLVTLLGEIPGIGKPLEALLGPDLTILINLGYGNPDYGFSAGPNGLLPANVPTPFGLFPDVNPQTVAQDLAAGAQTGFQHFASDLSSLSLSSLTGTSGGTAAPSLSDLLTGLSSPAAFSTTLTDVANAFSSAASSAYSTLLPTADIVNALVTSVPAYDASLFTDNLQNGDLMDALGLPVAANTALYTLAAGFEYVVISDAAHAIAADFGGLSP